jgi:hypothetical protein
MRGKAGGGAAWDGGPKHEMAEKLLGPPTAARNYSPRHPALGFAHHLDPRPDSVFEIVGVVGRTLFSIEEVHTIVARAHLAQSEAEMARDRFGFLVRHGASMPADAIRWRIAS